VSTVTVVPTLEPGHTPPRVRLDVTDSGTPALFGASVVRLDPDGRKTAVRTIDGGPLTLTTVGSDRVGTVYDYEPQYGATVSYSTLESPGLVTSPVILDVPDVWLVHVGIPALSMPIVVAGITGRHRPVDRGVFRPKGRKFPIVQSDGQRKAPSYTLTVRTTTDEQRRALDTLIDDSSVLLLNVPVAKGWGIGAEYVSIGDSDEDRLWQFAREQRRVWPLPMDVVDRPAGGVRPERTLADLVAFADLQAIADAYDSLFDVAAGP
jgi:hypothetical protein